MTDERAVLLANLVGEYARECVKEGSTMTEVGNMTVREVVSDIIDSTPQSLDHEIDGTARRLLTTS